MDILHISRWVKARDYMLEQGPEKFSMDNWIRKPRYEFDGHSVLFDTFLTQFHEDPLTTWQDAPCGTTCCFGGHIAVMIELDPEVKNPDRVISSRVIDYLGFEQGQWIFYTVDWPYPLTYLINNGASEYEVLIAFLDAVVDRPDVANRLTIWRENDFCGQTDYDEGEALQEILYQAYHKRQMEALQ